MIDTFHNHSAGLESPASDLQAVLPHDDQDLTFVTRAIAVGGEGFVQIATKSGLIGRILIVAGAPFPIRAARSWVSGTTATYIIALAG